jgi:hypothetical protein
MVDHDGGGRIGGQEDGGGADEKHEGERDFIATGTDGGWDGSVHRGCTCWQRLL